MMRIRRLTTFLTLGLVAGVVGCSDLLEVQDPSRFTDSDLDQALDAVARGVEGELHADIDELNTFDALISDVYKHTGTWSGWDDIDEGRIIYDNDGSSNGGLDILRARFAAQDASNRFDRVEADGGDVPDELWAQVLVTEGWADLLLGQHFCESVGDPTFNSDGTVTAGSVQSDLQMMQQAVTKLRNALSVAAGTDFALWAEAGVARGELFLGNYAEANTAATNVLANAPPGWSKNAQYQISTLENSIVNLATLGFNNAGGMREKWWPLQDDSELKLNDSWSFDNLGLMEPDPRTPVNHVPGILGVDGTTDYHSQWKYQDVGADIPITHLDEMRLIQAEVEWRNNDIAGARTILNALRTAAGLSPAPDAMADDSDEVLELLLNERFSALFMEGQRQIDLVRLGVIDDLIAAGDFVGTSANRPIKFPMSSAEALDNPNVEDDGAVRCLPRASI